MKILVLENPKEHSLSSYPLLEYAITSRGRESELVKNLHEAYSRLQSRDINLVIIHHYSFEDVAILKKAYPNVYFAISSADIFPKEECYPGTISETFRKKAEEHYDILLDDYGDAVITAMDSVEKKTKLK